jgi:hypothetical protein
LLEHPTLDRPETVSLVLAKAMRERGEVVADDKFGVGDSRIIKALRFLAGEVWQSVRLAIGSGKPKVFTGRVFHRRPDDRRVALLKSVGGHFAVDVQNLAGAFRSPAEKLSA